MPLRSEIWAGFALAAILRIRKMSAVVHESHFCDIARLRMDFRFGCKSGRAADIF